MNAPRTDSVATGLRLVRTGIGIVVGFAVFATTWLAWQAYKNPDVRLKRPRWVEGAFDHSFWMPVIVGVLFGAFLVVVVLGTALRRMRAGEDLFAQRHGRGQRRRGERVSDAGDSRAPGGANV